jgi:NAD+ kinase
LHARQPQAAEAAAALQKRYGQVPVNEADVIVALGGDGFLLHTLHAHQSRGLPIFGMKQGSVGFLMNEYRDGDLLERIAAAHRAELHPLRMSAECSDGRFREALAINEVALLRETSQAANLRVLVNGKEKLEALVCDGVLVATPAGSTAYNLSAHGPILPLGSPLLAMTPICPFRPRRWRGAILPQAAEIDIEVNQAGKRPVSATADAFEVREVRRVSIRLDTSISYRMLFDPDHNLEERILNEQFQP